MNIFPPNQVDFYKPSHAPMYPNRTVKISSNLTPRKSRMKGVNKVVVFGPQYWVLEILIRQWGENFFHMPKEIAIARYKRMMDFTLGKDAVSTKYMEDLWDLGYLPLHVKTLPEGTLCPIGVPCITITNTRDQEYWLVNYLETILSCTVWQPMTSATIAHEYKKLLSRYAIETTGSTDFVQFQGHDFSMRGMSSLESACTSGAGHLLSFSGSDTIAAIEFLEQYYGANIEAELVGTSVPATEHSVMCMGTKDDEIGTFRRLIHEIVPKGIISIVSDTWDLWKVCTEYLPILKDEILARDGKVVIRPDSGDPVDIICGTEQPIDYEMWNDAQKDFTPVQKGVIELLWDVFGGKINEYGYKELDPHIGAIYGDSITLERAEAICERLKAKGFASTNIVFGIGSYTYQYNTRDTFGFAMKATYGEVMEVQLSDEPIGDITKEVRVGREIFKSPITDSGEKKSAKGRLQVFNNRPDCPGWMMRYDGQDNLVLNQQVTPEQEEGGLLQTIFLDGKLSNLSTLSEIRERLNSITKIPVENLQNS